MLKNIFNFNLFVRIVRKNPGHYLVNVSALTICIATFAFIVSYIISEKSYDSFHQNKDRIFRLINIRYYPTKIDKSAGCMEKAGTEMKASFPEVEEYAHCVKEGQIININGQDYNEPNIYYTTPSFIKIFSFPIVKGNSSNYLESPFTCLISESIAKKYFGNEDPVGKQLDFVNKKPVTIIGIVKDIPRKSYFDFDILVSYSTMVSLGYCETCNNKNTFLLLSEKADKDELVSEFPDFITRIHKDDEFKREYLLQPLSDLHLNTQYRFEIGKTSNGNILIYLGIIGLLIIIIAWFNYISLNAIISLRRQKENGIKSISGARSSSIFSQIFMESFIMTFLAGAVGLTLIGLFLPTFCGLLNIELFKIPKQTYVTVGVIVFIGSVTTTLFPYVMYKKIRSVNVFNLLKFNKLKSGISLNLLIVAQNILAILLIAFSLLIYRQYKYMVDKELGFNSENILVVNNHMSQSTLNNPDKVFLDNLLQHPEISQVGFASYLPGTENGNVGGGFRLESQDVDKSIQIYEENVSGNFFNLLNIEILAGEGMDSDCSESGFPVGTAGNKLLLNESAVKQFGFNNYNDIIGKKIIREDRLLGTVQGVVKDYHQRSLDSPIAPSFYKNYVNTSYFFIKINPGNIAAAIDIIRKEYKSVSPSGIFDCYFLTDYFEKQYLSYSIFLQIILFFTSLAISICMIGMFSLLRYIIFVRTKEIGVRKVIGAKSIEVMFLLNKDFIKWVLIAFVIATPFAYLSIHKWLENFAYKTELSWWIFALAGAMALGIALLTVSWQSWQAARRNPVEALRYE
jgi:putative ABC transport system permease protein